MKKQELIIIAIIAAIAGLAYYVYKQRQNKLPGNSAQTIVGGRDPLGMPRVIPTWHLTWKNKSS